MLIIPCDLITDISLHNIANLHRTHDASLTMLLSSLPSQFYESVAPGARSKKPLGKTEWNIQRKQGPSEKMHSCTLWRCWAILDSLLDIMQILLLHYHLNKPKKLVSKDSKDFFLSIELNYAHNKHNFVFQIIENSSQKHKFA